MLAALLHSVEAFNKYLLVLAGVHLPGVVWAGKPFLMLITMLPAVECQDIFKPLALTYDEDLAHVSPYRLLKRPPPTELQASSVELSSQTTALTACVNRTPHTATTTTTRPVLEPPTHCDFAALQPMQAPTLHHSFTGCKACIQPLCLLWLHLL